MEQLFRTRVCPGVYWVPYTMLGEEQEANIRANYIDGIKDRPITSLIDAINAFVDLDYKEVDDTSIVKNNSLKWEMHVGGEKALRRNKGCCSTISAWVNQKLKGLYDEVGFFCLYRSTGSGHVMNYIIHREKIYIIDFLPFIRKYRTGICDQTGHRLDYLKVKYFTGLLYEIDSFEKFAKYYSRMTLKSGVRQIYWVYSAETVSPIAVRKKGDTKYVYIPDCYDFRQIGRTESNIQLIKYPLKEFDMDKYRFSRTGG